MEWLKQYLSAEKTKISGIPTARERWEYIWEYYKLWIIGAVCLVWFLSFAVYRYFFVPRDNWFLAVFTNTYSQVGNNSELWQDFVDYSGYDITEKKVEFNNNSFFDLTKTGGAINKYYEAFVAFADSGELDVVVMEQPQQLAAVGATGRLLDLDRPECAALRQRYADRLVYTTPNDEEYGSDRVAVGIDVRDSLLMTKYRVYGGETCVIGIGANSRNLDAVETFLRFILEEGAP